jgi:transcription antitermination protein NusB
MLGRRQFRIKVLQGLYAYFQGGESRIGQAEKQVHLSIEKIIDLYFLQFSFFLEIIDAYHQRMEDAKQKFYPTPEELNPNLRFLHNRVIQIIQENKPLKRRIEALKLNWADESDNIRKVMVRIRESKDYKEYMQMKESSFDTDKKFVAKILKKILLRSPELQFFCEERSIHWVDDFEIAATLVVKTIKLLPEDFPENRSLESLFTRAHPEEADEEKKFISDLFRKTILHSEEFETMIKGRLKNWELDRIAMTDILLIKMALAEFLFFPTIPTKVTLNEYIELSKHFSTSKSKLFVNGILDKLLSDLIESERVNKEGRGLIN